MSGAVKHDHGKLRLVLITPEMTRGLGEVLTFGAGKYADRNWEKGLDSGRLLAACQRHLLAHQEGEVTDPESGLSHLAHAMCNLGMLLTLEQRRKMTAEEKQLPLEKKTKPDQTPQEPAQAEAEGEELDSQPEGAIMPEDAIGCSVCAHSDGDGSTDAECCHECDDELSNFTPLSIPQEQPANAGAVQ